MLCQAPHTEQAHGFLCISSCALFFLFSPVPTISWRRADGKQIPRKARRHRSSGLLEIPNFQQEDAGPYECVAENVRGKNVARGQLTFYGKQAARSQGFIAASAICSKRFVRTSFCQDTFKMTSFSNGTSQEGCNLK